MRSEQEFETEWGKAVKELEEVSKEYYPLLESGPALPKEFWIIAETFQKAYDQVCKLLDERYPK